MSQHHSETTILLIHGLSGSISGTLTTFFLYPLENIKTRMQVLHKQEKKSIDEIKDSEQQAIPTKENTSQETNQTMGLIKVVQKVLEEDGLKGFYKGVLPLCLGSFISYGVYFSSYEFLKHFLEKTFKLRQTNMASYALTSLIAGTLTTFATNPFWVVNTKMTMDKSKRSFKAIFQQLIHDEGLTGLLKGLKASLVLVSNPIIQFILYENLKKRNKNVPFQSFWNFIYGALSKAIATLVTFPYQVIRTNVQLEKDKQIKEIIKLIYEKNGFFGYYRGLAPKLTQTVINSALMLMIYEKILLMIKKSFG